MFLSGDEAVKKWGCSYCKGDEFHEGDDMRSLRNCDGDGSGNLAFAWMPSLRRCPWSLIDSATSEVLRWWCDWKSFDLLPWRGTLLEQPAFVVEVIQFCETIRVEAESAAHDSNVQRVARGK